MKKLLLCLSVLASLSAIAQTPKKVTLTFTEDQLQKLYFVILAGQESIFDSQNISALQAKQTRIFSDSLLRSWVEQFQKWNPAPAPVKDSTTNKPPVKK